jgi:hypothetical protein
MHDHKTSTVEGLIYRGFSSPSQGVSVEETDFPNQFHWEQKGPFFILWMRVGNVTVEKEVY